MSHRAARILGSILVLLLEVLAIVAVVAALLLAAGAVRAGPADAVVRIRSHGCSGTVIWTGPGRSLVLSCGHAYASAADRRKPHQVDVPTATPGAMRTGGISLVMLDLRADLALVEVLTGPLVYVTPVAPAGHRPGRAWSCGYDEMRLPCTVRVATILSSQGASTWTREKPWHGRSGGGLIDPDHNMLLGTCTGYETGPGSRGIYTSLAAVRKFLWGPFDRRPAPAPQRLTLPAPCPPSG